jgi:aspartate aminotransferase-like enzyme
MNQPDKSALLDLPPYPADGYARLADRLGRLLRTRNDVLLIQGEAILALEAVAASVGSPGLAALNIVTSPYGALFGHWLRRSGAQVENLIAEPAKPMSVDSVRAALAAPRIDLVSLVHAESASGIVNPLPEIVRLAKERGATVILDAVASIGGHELDVDDLGIDLVVIGAQKALAGSSGLSAIALGKNAWRLIDRAGAPENSVLSLMDIKRDWLDAGRGVLPGMPSAIEFFALEAAIDRVEAEGVAAIIARHQRAAAATRHAVRALGLSTWVGDACSSALVTSAAVPAGIEVAKVLEHAALCGADLSSGIGTGAERLLRLNHTGNRAQRESVEANVDALARALAALGMRPDLVAARAAVAAHYDVA